MRLSHRSGSEGSAEKNSARAWVPPIFPKLEEEKPGIKRGNEEGRSKPYSEL